jgi:hypothetical protein
MNFARTGHCNLGYLIIVNEYLGELNNIMNFELVHFSPYLNIIFLLKIIRDSGHCFMTIVNNKYHFRQWVSVNRDLLCNVVDFVVTVLFGLHFLRLRSGVWRGGNGWLCEGGKRIEI